MSEVHKPYLGFCWKYHGKNTYFVFNSLPFGISSAGNLFTKTACVVVTYLRSLGHKIVMFLDDGIGGYFNYGEALRSSQLISVRVQFL